MIFLIFGPKLFEVFLGKRVGTFQISELNFDIVQSMLVPLYGNFSTLPGWHGSCVRTSIDGFDIVRFDLSQRMITLNKICAEVLLVTVTVCVICSALYSIVSQENSNIS